MNKYISFVLVFVVVLLVTAMIIRWANDSEEVYDGWRQIEEENDMPSKSNFVEQYQFGLEIPGSDCEAGELLIIKHGFTLSYNPKTLTAKWVAYELTAEETDGPWSRKGLRFMPDPDCHERQADHEDYRNSGYSRGHLAPAGDMKWDSLSMLESFYFTNCIPQETKFNNGKWNQLEEKTRRWAKQYGKVYIVCGPVYRSEDTIRIGHNGVAVPDACFKALLVPKDNSFSAITFLMRNGDEKRSVKECAITVNELESILGLDLFYNLPDTVEDSVECKIDWADWAIY